MSSTKLCTFDKKEGAFNSCACFTNFGQVCALCAFWQVCVVCAFCSSLCTLCKFVHFAFVKHKQNCQICAICVFAKGKIEFVFCICALSFFVCTPSTV